ncbi:hypothetical protein FDT66_11480 [Polaribacter aestuariivivens]|uniref:tRNA_anti-like n=1 Tax=Polaribacter aestuariivivens TaxID=2304626 RepID=A0A5S3N132_9FLAO|nr:hypothetical protein [Polaribacter aestuariivivens]TMM29001.1 hypothetical protein FDT66_11480 [Polaribacter aestuariivivens]
MKKKIVFFCISLALIFLMCVFYFARPLFVNSPKNIENSASEVAIHSDELVFNFISDEEKYNKLYAGKIIEVVGFVKEISYLNNTNTVILYSKNGTSGVICDILPNQKEKIESLKTHQKIKVKGICKGFLKDVILLNCYIDLQPNE